MLVIGTDVRVHFGIVSCELHRWARELLQCKWRHESMSCTSSNVSHFVSRRQKNELDHKIWSQQLARRWLFGYKRHLLVAEGDSSDYSHYSIYAKRK